MFLVDLHRHAHVETHTECVGVFLFVCFGNLLRANMASKNSHGLPFQL